MSTPVPSRAAIDAAEPLDWPARKPAKQELTITVHCRVNGFDTEICFSGQVDQLPAITKRIRALGGEPVSAAPVQAGAPLQRRATVTYDDDGSPLCGNTNCSRHGKPLEPSQHSGYFCKGKDDTTGNAKGYCRSKAD